jgi:hypothetical protein
VVVHGLNHWLWWCARRLKRSANSLDHFGQVQDLGIFRGPKNRCSFGDGHYYLDHPLFSTMIHLFQCVQTKEQLQYLWLVRHYILIVTIAVVVVKVL